MTESAERPKPVYRVFRNALSILLGDVGGDVLTTFAIGLSAIALGPADFGVLSEAQAFMDPFDSAAGFGLAQVAITVAARRRGCDGTLRGTVWALRTAFAVAAIVLANASAVATGRANLVPILMVVSVSTLVAPATAASTLPFSFEQTMHRLVALPFFASVVRLGTTYAAFEVANTPVGYQTSACIAALASALLVFVAAKRYYPAILRVDRALVGELLRLAWPAAVLEIVVVSYTRASYFLLHRAGAHVQGEFAAAERLVRPLFGISVAILMSALPTLASIAAERDFARLRRVYAASMGRTFAVLASAVVAASLLLPWIIRRFVPAYAGATGPFRWLAVATLFMLLNQVSTTFVVAMGKFKAIMTVALVNFAVYFVLASRWIPRYQATGAAMATTVMEGVNTLIQPCLVYFLLVRAERDA